MNKDPVGEKLTRILDGYVEDVLTLLQLFYGSDCVREKLGRIVACKIERSTACS
jgi:hypothetical protein